MNQACASNCEAIKTGDRMFILAIIVIQTGQELFIDHGQTVDGEITDNIPQQYACHCGASAAVNRCPAAEPHHCDHGVLTRVRRQRTIVLR
ncbi:hypothetical protein [Paraburkholderia piptadeniae]|uniref:hypothetical protein n=1 Tax=Paraburkholderia piptadeniae TaxID=1701573 RepID=UPI002E272FA7